jgi:hypothetical protein
MVSVAVPIAMPSPFQRLGRELLPVVARNGSTGIS